MQKNDTANLIAQKFLEKNDVIFFQGQFLEYENGIWKILDESILKGRIIEVYNKCNENYSITKLKNTLDYLEIAVAQKYGNIANQIDERSKNEVVLKDGVLDVFSLKTRHFKKEDFFFSKLEYTFDQEYKCPQWLWFLDSIFELYSTDDRKQLKEFLQEWIGYTLIVDTSQEKCLILIGNGANGKSVLLEVWQSLLQDNNVSHIDIKDINTDQYTALLFGKLSNICADIQANQQLDSGNIKRIISGEMITAKVVYKQPFSFKPYSRLIFSANSLPYLKHIDNAILRRLHIIRFSRIFHEHEQDKSLKKKLLKELNDIFNWAITGLIRLKKRGYFLEPHCVKNEVQKFMNNNDPVCQFLEETGIEAGTIFTERSEIYEYFQIFVKDSGTLPMSATKFYEQLRMKGFVERKSNGKWGFNTCFIQNSWGN